MKCCPQRSLNNRLKCRKPVFMRVSGICFIKWLWFGSICGESNGVISFEKVNKKGRRYKLCFQQEKNHYSQRQIDVIKNEIIPKYVSNPEETGIITPYKNQVEALSNHEL